MPHNSMKLLILFPSTPLLLFTDYMSVH